MLAFWMALSLPSWLELHPGVKAEPNASPGMVEVNYKLDMKPAEAVEHFKGQFERAKLAFQPGADGIGISARVSAPECDLLMQFHPASAGTTVRIYCSAKAQPVQAAYVPAAAPTAAKGDGSGLVWPAWLGHLGTSERPRPESAYVAGCPCLRVQYKVRPEHRNAIIHGFRNLMMTYGFQIDKLQFQTGNTISGQVVEDFYGYTEGSQPIDGNSSYLIKAVFNRSNRSLAAMADVAVSYCLRKR